MSSDTKPSNSGTQVPSRAKILALINEESYRKAKQFQPRASDVIIVTMAKCGTTWMQQIVHQLRTGGDTDFVEIGMEIPWLEVAYHSHIDLDADQKASPRAYKTHLTINQCPEGCKYIIVCRNPFSAVYSSHKFLFEKFFSLESSIEKWLAGEGLINAVPWRVSYFTHLLSSLQHKDDPNVLLVFFEEMKEDRESVVRAVASFIGVQNEKNIQAAVELSSFKYMKANFEKFNDSITLHDRRKELGIDKPADIVRTGSTDEAQKMLSDDQKAIIQQKWESQVTKKIGYQTYEELRRSIRKERPLKK